MHIISIYDTQWFWSRTTTHTIPNETEHFDEIRSELKSSLFFRCYVSPQTLLRFNRKGKESVVDKKELSIAENGHKQQINGNGSKATNARCSIYRIYWIHTSKINLWQSYARVFTSLNCDRIFFYSVFSVSTDALSFDEFIIKTRSCGSEKNENNQIHLGRYLFLLVTMDFARLFSDVCCRWERKINKSQFLKIKSRLELLNTNEDKYIFRYTRGLLLFSLTSIIISPLFSFNVLS